MDAGSVGLPSSFFTLRLPAARNLAAGRRGMRKFRRSNSRPVSWRFSRREGSIACQVIHQVAGNKVHSVKEASARGRQTTTHVNIQSNSCQHAIKISTCMSIKSTCQHTKCMSTYILNQTCMSKKNRMSTYSSFS